MSVVNAAGHWSVSRVELRAVLVDGSHASWQEARQAAQSGAPAVLPFGSFEQHGPHLPLTTDTDMAEALARIMADRLGGFLLPSIGYGDSAASDGYPGTLSLSFDTVRAVAFDICAGIQRSGFKCLIIVNGDSGNQAPLRMAARDARVRLDCRMLVVNYPGIDRIFRAVCETPPQERSLGHADELETSVMLAVRPAAVRMHLSVTEHPSVPEDFDVVLSHLEQLSSSGVFGDPTRASAEKGHQILGELVDDAVALSLAFLEGEAHR